MDNIDFLAKNLFKRLFKRNDAVPEEVLICPLCRDKLEPLIIDTSDNNDVREETVWWTCRGVNLKSCDFPLAMPPDIFWVKRSREQIAADVIPYPKIDLLPAEYQHLYPDIFKQWSSFIAIPKLPNVSTDSPKKSRKPLIHQREQRLAALNIDIGKTRNGCVRNMSTQRTELESEEIARQLRQIEFGDATSKRKVNLFPDSRVALDSLISLKFSGESFLSGLNSAMCQKRLVKPHPAIHHRQRMDIMRNSDVHIMGDILNEQTIKSANTPRFLAQSKKKMTESEKKEISNRLNMMVTRIPIELADRSLQIRLGKRNRADLPAAAENDINWNEMGLGVPKVDDPKSLRKLCCPPPSSLSSGDLSSQSESVGPKVPIIPIKSVGDEELDNLIRSNLNNLLRSGTLRRRKKRKLHSKSKATTASVVESADKPQPPPQPAAADNSFMHMDSGAAPFVADDHAFYDEHHGPGILDDDFFTNFGNPHDF